MEEAMTRRSNKTWEQQAIINELKQGRELAKQLKNHLNPSTASSQTRQFLIEKIISSYEKTLTKLNSASASASSGSKSNGNECQKSSSNNHRIKGSNHQIYNSNQASSNKRKPLPKWTEQVQVRSETGYECPLDDGHSWRKYGQKDILGAIHPRGYYRCTHRHVQGCLATKHIQRSDEDPTIFSITYRSQHTCSKVTHFSSLNTHLDQAVGNHELVEREKRIKLDQFRFSFGARNKNEDNYLAFPTFSSFANLSTNNPGNEYMYIPSTEAHGNHIMSSVDDGSGFSPFYTTSDSDFFQASYGLSELNVDRSECDLAEGGSCLNSVSNSPMGVLDLDLDFPTGTAGADFDTSFLFGFLDL